jgi:hypothetical protein
MVPRRLNIQRIVQRLAEMNLTMDGFKARVGLDRRTNWRLCYKEGMRSEGKTTRFSPYGRQRFTLEHHRGIGSEVMIRLAVPRCTHLAPMLPEGEATRAYGQQSPSWLH